MSCLVSKNNLQKGMDFSGYNKIKVVTYHFIWW